MDPQTKIEFEKLLSIKGNSECIDCGQLNPKWASVNNGCFICIKCAGNHRSMGVHISFVRSITLDGWSKIQLARIKNGGNQKLKDFWKTQKFATSLTPKQRLDNIAMDKYRDTLLRKAKSEATKPIGFIGYQTRVIQSKPNVNRTMEGFGNTEYSPNNNANSNNALLTT
eukprot:406773_1